MKLLSYLVIATPLSVTLWLAPVMATDKTPGTENCKGLLYRSKKDGIPVYESPDVTSSVLRKLGLGEKVCRIGEMGQFQILRWDSFIKHEDGEAIASSSAFARTVDLWEARDMPGRKHGMLESVTGFFKLLFSGGMAEDPLLPYRPLMIPEKTPDLSIGSCSPQPQDTTCPQ